MRRTSPSPGPRDLNHARSSADSVPVVAPLANALRMWSSSRPVWPAAYSSDAQPPLTVSSFYRLVRSEFQAIVGTIASIRLSIAAATSSIPPA
jgi:hypothetical protein